MNLQIKQGILSFREIPALAERAAKSVVLLRHSMRESLNKGSNPGLTPDGTAYARQSGTFLTGLRDAGFGASPRKRSIETAAALRLGMDGTEGEIRTYQDIADTFMFVAPDGLDQAIRSGRIPEMLREYYFSGHTDGMKDLKDFSAGLLRFLTETDFPDRNTILISHDIVIVSLLAPLKVYPFRPADWCGYVQGAALFRSPDGNWSIYYTVPDLASRKETALFI